MHVRATRRKAVESRPIAVRPWRAVALGAIVVASVAGGNSVSSAASSGLVAAYSFNEGAGTVVADASGNGNSGTASATTWSSAGKFGSALSFTAAQRAFVAVADSATLHLTSLTLEAWVKPVSVSGSWRTVLFKERSGGMAYALYANNDADRPVGQVYTSGEQSAPGSSLVPSGTWTHLATTYSAGTLKLFVNGTQVSSVPVPGAVVSSTGPLKIGGNAIWDEWFDGLIDEVRVYNRALAAAEIQTDMATPIGEDSTPPTAPTGLAVTQRGPTSIALSWNAAVDNVGVTSYGVYRDGVLVQGVSSTSAQVNGLACATAYTFAVDAVDQAGNRSARTSVGASTAACDTSPPAVQLTAPSAGATLSGSVTVTATAQDDVSVAGVQFRIDGADLGAEDTAAPYSLSWDTTTSANGGHTIVAVARDSSGNRTVSSGVGVTVQNAGPPLFAVDEPITGLDQPTQLVFAPDGRMLILERKGTILVVQPGADIPDPTPLLELDAVDTSDERGALGIVLDPDFETNGFFYVMYTHSSLVNRLSRFTAVGGVASPSSERVIWQNDVPAAIYHQGGGLAFGPDGYLYVSVGDNLDRDSAQDLSSFNGKILRLRSDGTVPPDNPFVDGAGPNEDAVWALGLRNPFRFSFDSATGRMLIGDVGEGTWEEVDVGTRGANYGWPLCEGTCGRSALTDPLFAYPHNGRDASITGGFVYHGGTFGAGYEGTYFYADYAQNTLRRLTFDGAGKVAADIPFLPADGQVDGPYGDPVDLRQGPDGALYYVDIGSLNTASSGGIRRVRNVNGNAPPTASASSSTNTGPPPLTVAFSSAGSSDPEGAALTYQWSFGDGGNSSAPHPTHTFAASGAYTVRLSVSDGVNTTFATPLTITVGTPPRPAITAPEDGTLFVAGQQIGFAGGATDAEDGTLAGSSLRWTVVFHHETHQHPGPGPFSGGSGSFTIPTSGHDFTGNTSYEIVLTATDSTGLSSSTSVTIFPKKVNVTYTSSPPGLSLVVDSLAHATPYTFDSLVGFHHTLEAPSPQSLAGTGYTFASWSDGGARVHDVVVPSADATVTAAFTQTAQRPGLVAAYGFDEGAGTTVTDSSSNGNNGSIANGTWSTAGKYGNALSFNGSSTLVTVPAAPSLNLTTGMTLEAWVNPSAIGSVWRTVIFKERPGGMLYSLYAGNGGPQRPVGQVFLANAEQNAVGASTLPLNVWTHLAATFDGSTLRLYVNGSLTSTFAVSGTLATTTSPLRVGGNSIWGEYFRGRIDDVRIYNRALSAAEIGSDLATRVGG
jgi:glucose/arabinose dehydrogenase/PKD repeat protein